jgi:hypothetical protein
MTSTSQAATPVSAARTSTVAQLNHRLTAKYRIWSPGPYGYWDVDWSHDGMYVRSGASYQKTAADPGHRITVRMTPRATTTRDTFFGSVAVHHRPGSHHSAEDHRRP